MAESLDPTTSWPRHLQAVWRDCAERGEVNPHNPPTSIVEAYLQVAAAQRRRLAGIPWGDPAESSRDEEEEIAEGCTSHVICSACGATNLEHFYTAKRTSWTLCAARFQQRVEQGTVRKAASAGS